MPEGSVGGGSRPAGRTLVAGVGNVFRSDDGFGCAVAGELLRGPVPPGVEVVDYGIRGLHLAFDVDDRVEALVVVDTVPETGGPPGSLAVLEIDRHPVAGPPVDPRALDRRAIDPHAMDPGSVLGTLVSIAGRLPPTWVVGCRPADLTDGMGLSDTVAAAVPVAAAKVLELVRRLRTTDVLSADLEPKPGGTT